MRSTWHNKPGVPSGKCGFRSRTPASSDAGTGRMAAHAFGELNKGAQPLTQASALSFMALTTRTGRSRASSRRRASARSSLREGPVVCMRLSNNMQGMPNSDLQDQKQLPLQRIRVGHHHHHVRMLRCPGSNNTRSVTLPSSDCACRLYKPGRSVIVQPSPPGNLHFADVAVMVTPPNSPPTRPCRSSAETGWICPCWGCRRVRVSRPQFGVGLVSGQSPFKAKIHAVLLSYPQPTSTCFTDSVGALALRELRFTFASALGI